MTVDVLAELVRRRYPSATIEVTHFPSGVAMMDTWLSGRFFVVESHPKHGIGVDEVLEDDGFNTGYHHGSPDIFGASVHLLGLLDGAAAPREAAGDAGARQMGTAPPRARPLRHARPSDTDSTKFLRRTFRVGPTSVGPTTDSIRTWPD